MKATLTFDLEDPHDREQLNGALHAVDWYSVVFELDQWLRQATKYGTDESGMLTSPVRQFADRTRQMIGVLMDTHGVSLEDFS